MKTVLICILTMFVVMSFSRSDEATLFQTGSDDVIEHTFKVRSGGTLLVDTDRGSIEVVPGKSDEVHVVIERKSRGASDEEMDQLEFSFDEERGQVSVLGKFMDESSRRWNRSKFNIHMRIEVPEKFNIDLNTAGGSVSVDDLIGTVDAKTSGGSLSFGRINGPVNGRTSGGSISLKGSNGDASLNTSGGSITLGQIRGNVEAETSGGSITIEEVQGSVNASTSGGGIRAYISKQPTADSRLSTGGGSVTVELDPSIKVNVSAQASGGSVKTQNLDIDVTGKKTRTRLQGEMNGGGPMLELRTSGGGVTLKAIR